MSGAASCQSTDKSVCATRALPASASAQVRQEQCGTDTPVCAGKARESRENQRREQPNTSTPRAGRMSGRGGGRHMSRAALAFCSGRLRCHEPRSRYVPPRRARGWIVERASARGRIRPAACVRSNTEPLRILRFQLDAESGARQVGEQRAADRRGESVEEHRFNPGVVEKVFEMAQRQERAAERAV